MRALPATLGLALALALAGCASGADDHHHMMDGDSFHMTMMGMPSGPMAPGQPFNVTVRAMAGHEDMHGTSDHIGAHMWNMSVADPTAGLGNATACQHTGGDLPGEYRVQCTAPMQPGTYHVRAHARMMDDDGAMHHWWGPEHSFTVAAQGSATGSSTASSASGSATTTSTAA